MRNTTPYRPPCGRVPRILAPLALCGTLLQPAPSARSESAPIFVDGFFSDWTGVTELVGPAGDGGSSGIDFRDVDLANDDALLFLRFQTTVEVGIQANGTDIVLHLDTDMNPLTGLPILGIGAELEWRFGSRNGTFHTGTGSVAIRQDESFCARSLR